ncbi:transferrin-binding protein-like solute binding protein [Falsigemmobacter intermedius]|uniref:Transferrin-binding protein B C-lobe/N-lobe beta-barrel domain-containing protein n=1 Tax=Falsigemmobacter intermedius TaxID=1553448 RepID=A0A3S3UHI2_9RHOB|nr:transferrin-binding protein-like solute binding protein [Falsigemmobacter intermedius]RWY33924.1 hypothetical protein EP867_19460 [Falsigemmobacter intermedius]
MKICIAVVSSTFFLAACGGSGGGSQASFSTMESRGTALIEKLEGQSATPVSAMPSAGSATYSGIAGFAPSIYDEVEVLSEASLTANFASSTIAGNLTNFRDYQNTAIPGSVNIHSGVISGNEFGADLTGSLTVDGRASAVDGSMAGAFVGANAGGVVGLIEGTVGSQYMVGVLGAEK